MMLRYEDHEAFTNYALLLYFLFSKHTCIGSHERPRRLGIMGVPSMSRSRVHIIVVYTVYGDQSRVIKNNNMIMHETCPVHKVSSYATTGHVQP